MSAVGAFTWVELRTTDVGGARAFYGEVAGWRCEATREGGTFHRGQHVVAGLSALPEQAGRRGSGPSGAAPTSPSCATRWARCWR
jgi:predicted enzyme related to lactoylglutathione lyase